MPLFDKIRKQTDSTFARVFFVIIVLTFVFWGLVNPNAPQAETYAEVNGIRILNTQVLYLKYENNNYRSCRFYRLSLS